jgi:serine/threonine protein kinase
MRRISSSELRPQDNGAPTPRSESRPRDSGTLQDVAAAIKLARDDPSHFHKEESGPSNSPAVDPKVEEMRQYILKREGVASVEFIAKGGQGTAFLISMSDGTTKFGKVIDIGDINKLINNRAEFRETLAGKGLKHKGIPRSHVTESFNDDTQYLFIRDYVTGVSLKELIQQKGKLSSEEAKGYLLQGLELLEYLHDAKKHPEVGQVIHRDVKPSNIIIDRHGKLFLVDFGCAHFRTPNEQSMTKNKMGTEGYMSGEQQIGGARASSDLYSLGITILEGLIADRPLLVDKLKINWFNDTIGQPFEIPSDLEICPQLRRVLQKMIKANHAERYKSAGEAAAALDRPGSGGIFDSLTGIFNWSRMFNLNRSSQRKEDRANLAVSEIKDVDGYQAVVGQITVKGRQLDTLLTEGSFNKSREDQWAYAKKLGYRMATRQEHRAYVVGLLAKEADDSINEAEAKALETYRERYVRDTQGGLDVTDRHIAVFYDHSFDESRRLFGALFVRKNWSSIFSLLVPFWLRQGYVRRDKHRSADKPYSSFGFS